VESGVSAEEWQQRVRPKARAVCVRRVRKNSSQFISFHANIARTHAALTSTTTFLTAKERKTFEEKQLLILILK
jgi:hypothetical protein